jgi:NAD(P)-dependent dehydrogenase (short-subunit alcohol dehydrogenase family)
MTDTNRSAMTGKVCLVTGATDGIGQETARALASMGATVILHGRNPAKMAQTIQAITAQTGSESVHSLLADFADFAQVRDLAAQVKATYERLDVLVNNAGVIMFRRKEIPPGEGTPAGLEMTFAVNHLAPFLLTNLLLDRLKASAPARIVTVSSSAHKRGALDFDDLQHTRRYRPMQVYGDSKLANVLFTYELARRLDGTGVTANTLHPGLVGTNLAMNNLGPLAPIGQWLLRRYAISVEEGARTVVYLAASPEVEGVTGQYFYQEHAISSSAASHDEDAQRRLWAISEELTGLRS